MTEKYSTTIMVHPFKDNGNDDIAEITIESETRAAIPFILGLIKEHVILEIRDFNDYKPFKLKDKIND